MREPKQLFQGYINNNKNFENLTNVHKFPVQNSYSAKL